MLDKICFQTARSFKMLWERFAVCNFRSSETGVQRSRVWLNIAAGLGCFCLHNLLSCLWTLPTGNSVNFTEETVSWATNQFLPNNPLSPASFPSEFPGLLKLQCLSVNLWALIPFIMWQCWMLCVLIRSSPLTGRLASKELHLPRLSFVFVHCSCCCVKTPRFHKTRVRHCDCSCLPTYVGTR